MLCRNNPTNPNKPQPFFLAKDHLSTDVVSREPGDEAVMRYMLIYQATRGWCTKTKRYVGIEIDEMILFYCKSKRLDPHIPLADAFVRWDAVGQMSNSHRVTNNQQFHRGVTVAITSSPRHITINSGPSKQVITVKSMSLHSNTPKTVVWRGER
jgi:hypothetical protein